MNEICSNCAGKGYVVKNTQLPVKFDKIENISEIRITCEICNGTGKIEIRCRDFANSRTFESMSMLIKSLTEDKRGAYEIILSQQTEVRNLRDKIFNLETKLMKYKPQEPTP